LRFRKFEKRLARIEKELKRLKAEMEKQYNRRFQNLFLAGFAKSTPLFRGL